MRGRVPHSDISCMQVRNRSTSTSKASIKGLRPCCRPQEFYRFLLFFRDFGFLTHGMCRYDHFKILDFRQHLNFENLRPDFSSEGHFWVVRSTFPLKSPYMGRTDLYLLVESPYMGRTEPIFLEKVLKIGSSVSPISAKTPYMGR